MEEELVAHTSGFSFPGFAMRNFPPKRDVAAPFLFCSGDTHCTQQKLLNQHHLESAEPKADVFLLSFAGASWTEGRDGKNTFVCLWVMGWFAMMLSLSWKQAQGQGSNLTSADALAASLIL